MSERQIRITTLAELQHKFRITRIDAGKLITISNRLHRWYELEYGNDEGAISRDEETGELKWYSNTFHKWTTYQGIDEEKHYTNLLRQILARYDGLYSYLQHDPRGIALYLANEPMTCQNYSTRGYAVCH